MMLLCSGIVPIPAVAASFSRESLNTSSEVRQEVTSSLARSASLQQTEQHGGGDERGQVRGADQCDHLPPGVS